MPIANRVGAFVLSFVFGCGGKAPPGTDSGAVSDCARICDDGLFCNGTEECAPGHEEADEDGCLSGQAPCEGACDDAEDVCSVDCDIDDADGDGHRAEECGGDDCDDNDANRSPSQVEVCDADGVDEDCDPTTVGSTDLDGDGFVSSVCCNEARCGDDCDDDLMSRNPSQVEVCDSVDNDCDASVDEDTNGVPWYPDDDGDGFGDASRDPMVSCSPVEGHVLSDSDCDDSDININPLADEILGNGVDEDCDGLIDMTPAGGCDSGRPPQRPEAGLDGIDGPELAFALNSLTLEDSGGVNLDRLCTTLAEPVAECATDADVVIEDGVDGADNAFGSLVLPTLRVALGAGFTEATVEARWAQGSLNPLIRVSGYDGDGDDPSVDVVFAHAAGGTSEAAAGVQFVDGALRRTSDGSPAAAPIWDGGDVFFPRADEFVDGDLSTPLIRDDAAFVVGGMLVARLPDRTALVLADADGSLTLRLTEIVLQLDLSGLPSSISRVVIAGRWSLAEASQSLDAVGLCSGTVEAGLARAQIERSLDLLSDSTQGGGTPPCAALSVGIELAGTRVTWANVGPRVSPPDLCD